MGVVMHPLTMLNGYPSYTAADYRQVINPLLLPSNGTPFDGIQGVRAGCPQPLVTIDGVTVTVKSHCGTVSPWPNVGAYTYALTTPVSLSVASTTGDYKIAVVVDDPSQSHGTAPRGMVKVFDASVSDAEIPGLVIANVSSGVVSDVAPILRSTTVVEVYDQSQLNTIGAVDGQEAVVGSTGRRYRLIGGVWQSLDDIQLSPGQWYKDWSYVDYKCSMVGNVVTISIKVGRGPEWAAKAWDRSQILTFPDYVKPSFSDLNIPAAGVEHSGFQVDKTGLYVRPFADVTYYTGAWSSALFSYSV
jgi:hypothetical protein